jgi:DNA-binding PadR family transcriptional regulator
MRRAAGTLVPLEIAILSALLDAERRSDDATHGYAIAGAIQRETGASRLTAYGSLYKALERLERSELVASRWEDPAAAALEGRPRRRSYRITAAGATALETAVTRASTAVVRHPRPGKAQAPSS